MIIVDSGVKRNTKNLVERVSFPNTRNADINGEIINVIDAISEKFFGILGKNCEKTAFDDFWFEDLKNLFFVSQCMLKALKASVPEIERIVEICEGCGCAAKLTGAGGGGAVLGLVLEEKGFFILVI